MFTAEVGLKALPVVSGDLKDFKLCSVFPSFYDDRIAVIGLDPEFLEKKSFLNVLIYSGPNDLGLKIVIEPI